MEDLIKSIYVKIEPYLNEKQKRLFVAACAEGLGRGGRVTMNRISGLCRASINDGIRELNGESPSNDEDRIRREGGGRKQVTEKQAGIVTALLQLVDGHRYGNPENPLSWTTKSTRKLSKELMDKGYTASHMTVGKLLESCGFSLQQNQKMEQVGEQHPDRDAQFCHINDLTKSFIAMGVPVISVDCKKKENVGLFKNGGAEWRPVGEPLLVLDHDFPLPDKGKAAPYGIYDIGKNQGFVNVGISSDTAEFAVASIRSWWYSMGEELYPGAKYLAITADGGGSNGSRDKLWKAELQNFANETGLTIIVRHFPPGTPKWNKIEHRLFSQISKNWRGRPLETLEMIVSLIGATTTEATDKSAGLRVMCKLDKKEYKTGITVTDEELSKVRLVKDDFHGEWNYAIIPYDL